LFVILWLWRFRTTVCKLVFFNHGFLHAFLFLKWFSYKDKGIQAEWCKRGCGGNTPCILDVGTQCRWVVSSCSSHSAPKEDGLIKG
jgi:hypothetical protein